MPALSMRVGAQDTTYSSAALRQLVGEAAVANHAPPPAFRGYRAHVESELSLILRDTLGRERAAQLEQFASTLDWARGGNYEMHIVGYRSQTLGSPVSTLSFVRGWTEPSLYGERLRLGVQLVGDTTRVRDTVRADNVIAVHPFAADRDRYYRFSGGDTITVLRSGGRAITIVRVRTIPHLADSTRLAAFDGEIDLDAERRQIVRMRGTFVVLGPRRSRSLLVRMTGLVGVAYAEFVNTEVNGTYWLPASQRTEFQTTFPFFGRTRAVMRVMSSFSNYTVDDTSTRALETDSVNRIQRSTTWATNDTVSRFTAWTAGLGDATSSVHADDFDDFAPDAWKDTGSPRVDFVPAKAGNLVRFDRVEGLYTGIEANVYLRNAMPGASVGALAGVAWSERTVRGGVHASLARRVWTFGARAERELATTNDFIRPFEPRSGGLAAMLGSLDDFDYVDRRLALATVRRAIGATDDAIVVVQLGTGDDRAVRAHVSNGVFGGAAFLPNRGALEGGYALASVDVELHPSVSGDFVQPGFGANLHAESARGTLAWDRAELTLSGRRYWGALALSAEAQGGIVRGDVIPPQQLFELGGSAELPGYAYKEFAGDRAALVRGFASYAFPLWRTPRRVFGTFVLPGVAPGLGFSVQGGWTEVSGDAARVAVLGLGTPSRATNGMRATAGFGVTFFSGLAHVGMARALEPGAAWKFVVGLGPTF